MNSVCRDDFCALDAARSQVEAAHKRAADADALLRDARLTIELLLDYFDTDGDDSGELIARIDAHLGGGNGNG